MTVRIGIDTGGTFTDCVIVDADGRVGVGKALSTHGALPVGVLGSIERAAADVGRPVDEVLAAADAIAYGTTVGLNALLTRTGASTGLLTTAGFEGVLPIARANKVIGLSETDVTEAVRWDKPPMLMSRQAIRGVRERIDARGDVLVPLDEAQARSAIGELRDAGVTSYAISLLWSVANPDHEQRLAELVAEEHPEAHVSVSSELAPRIGEYERTMTVVLDAYVAPLVADELRSLTSALGERGFAGTFLVMQSSGGVRPVDRAVRRTVETLSSGPVGGVTAAARTGFSDVVATDVGGTSFDVGIVHEGRVTTTRRPLIDRYALAAPVVEVVSIGTGGGSIAWLDPILGSLRVGPQSAGADPGPACYGRGGQQPTVTDAAVVLGYLERLGGTLSLDQGAAVAAIERAIAGPLGRSVTDAAEDIVRVACAQMADLVRRLTVQRGHDPRRFTLLAYGGAAPQYAGRYAAAMGLERVVVPRTAPVFSAFGALMSDVVARAEREVRPVDPMATDLIDATLDQLEARARAELGGDAPTSLVRYLGLRFTGQVRDLHVPHEGSVADTLDRFRADYERLVGPGAAARGAGIELVAVGVDARRSLGEVTLPALAPAEPGEAVPTSSRRVWFAGRETDTPVHDGDKLGAGAAVTGPALVELATTTAVVPPGQRAVVDDHGNLVLHLGEAR